MKQWLGMLSGVILGLALVLPGCACAGNDLAGSQWELKSYGTETSQTDVLADTRITLVFNTAADRASGRAGCNSYGGECQVRGRDIRFSDLFQTEMACQDPAGIMLQESKYLALLGKAETFSLDAVELRIYSQDRGLLIFVRSIVPAGSRWQLKSLGAQNAQASVLAGTRITLDFDVALTGITGSAGCNTYSGDALIQGARITLSGISQTKKNCTTPAGIMNQESAYLNLLAAAQNIKIKSGELFIYCGGGLLVFKPAD